MPLKACTVCGRPSDQRRCPAHHREQYAKQDASRRARGKRHGSTRSYRKARTEALARDGYRCTYVERGRRCTATSRLETHHRNGNPRDDRAENLATICPEHHNLIERKLNAKRYKGLRVICLVGSPGCGKTTLGRQIAKDLSLPFAGIDDFGARGDRDRRWSGLMGWITSHRCPVMVESNVVMPELGELLDSIPHLVIELQAPESTRAERLRKRGEREAEINRMLSAQAIGYTVDRVETDCVDTVARLTAFLADAIERGESK